MSKFKIIAPLLPKMCESFFLARKREISNHLLRGFTLMKVFQDKFFTAPENKVAKYWSTEKSLVEYIHKADDLFDSKKYLEVYETLNKIKFGNEIEVVWRLARVLFIMANQNNVPPKTKQQMIDEAYNALNLAKEKENVKSENDVCFQAAVVTRGNGRANYHKWMAIILDAKNGLDGLKTRIRHYPTIRDHLTIACEKNPRDFTAQYMLGRMCYEIASLTWFQRKIAKYMLEEPPKSTYQEAYKHLNMAEELKPRSCIQNMCVLAKACVKLGQFYRARYYLNLALSLRPHQESERKCLSHAKILINKLEKYDLGRELYLDNFMFTFDD